MNLGTLVIFALIGGALHFVTPKETAVSDYPASTTISNPEAN